MTRKTDSVTDIDVKILRSVYNMPIEQAAKQLGVCVTVLKRICRRKGIARWPYRKLKSINKMIDSIEEYSADQGEPGKVSGHLAKLKLMRDNILQSPSSDDEADEEKQSVNSNARKTSPENNSLFMFKGSFSAHDQSNKTPIPTSSPLPTGLSGPASSFVQNLPSIANASNTLPGMNSFVTIDPTTTLRNSPPSEEKKSFKFVSSPYEHEVHTLPSVQRSHFPQSISSQFVNFERMESPAQHQTQRENFSHSSFPGDLSSPKTTYQGTVSPPQSGFSGNVSHTHFPLVSPQASLSSPGTSLLSSRLSTPQIDDRHLKIEVPHESLEARKPDEEKSTENQVTRNSSVLPSFSQFLSGTGIN